MGLPLPLATCLSWVGPPSEAPQANKLLLILHMQNEKELIRLRRFTRRSYPTQARGQGQRQSHHASSPGGPGALGTCGR